MESDQGALVDSQIISASLDDPSAFGALFDRYFVTIYRYLARRCGSVEADDLTSEVFRIAFERRFTFDLSSSCARPWLYGIATNVLRTNRRREYRHMRALRRVESVDVGSFDAADDFTEVDDRVDATGQRSALIDALSSLADGDRDALVLFGVEGLAYGEVAVALDIPVGTVRSRIHRARRRLRELIEVPGQELGDRFTMEVRHDG